MTTPKKINADSVTETRQETAGTPQVYVAISAVMSDLSTVGISKDRKNTQQGFAFRGIDDVYNALSSVMSKHGLVMLPRVISRDVVERTTKNGGALNYVTVDMEFVLVSAVDGSRHTIRTFGEAMDSADKGTNKAMSAAFKYAAMQAFCIPTVGDNDADATTQDEIEPTPPAGPARDPERVAAYITDISSLNDEPTHRAWIVTNRDGIAAMHPDDHDDIARAFKARAVTIKVMGEQRAAA